MLLEIEARAPFMMLTNTLTAEPAPLPGRRRFESPCNLMKIALFSPFADEKTEAQKRTLLRNKTKRTELWGWPSERQSL